MVIQRWQSLILLLACVLMAMFSFMSLGQFQTTDYSFNVTTSGIFYEGEATGNAPSGIYASTYYFFAISLLSAFLPLLTVFLYKNLRLQMNCCLIEILLLIAVIVISILESFYAIDGADMSWSSIICAPFLSLVLMIIAWRLIRKDRNLLRSADRLR